MKINREVFIGGANHSSFPNSVGLFHKHLLSRSGTHMFNNSGSVYNVELIVAKRIGKSTFHWYVLNLRRLLLQEVIFLSKPCCLYLTGIRISFMEIIIPIV